MPGAMVLIGCHFALRVTCIQLFLPYEGWDTYLVDDVGIRCSLECCIGLLALQWKEEMREFRVDERRKRRDAKEDGEKGEDVHVEASWISVVDVWGVELLIPRLQASQSMFLY